MSVMDGSLSSVAAHLMHVVKYAFRSCGSQHAPAYSILATSEDSFDKQALDAWPGAIYIPRISFWEINHNISSKRQAEYICDTQRDGRVMFTLLSACVNGQAALVMSSCHLNRAMSQCQITSCHGQSTANFQCAHGPDQGQSLGQGSWMHSGMAVGCVVYAIVMHGRYLSDLDFSYCKSKLPSLTMDTG
jgi:hypothetical protein